jgi:L-cysteine desulfidase
MLYSYKNQYPIDYENIPDRIRLSNGSTRTDKSTYTTEELIDAGYISVDDPPEVDLFQRLVWNGNSWVVETLSDEERNIVLINQWNIVRAERNRLLKETDWMMMKYSENNDPLSTVLAQYRQQLRDIPETQTDPFNIVWPVLDRNSTDTEQSDA